MNFFWVNVGTSFKEIKEYNFLWAPQFGTKKNGTKYVSKGWETVKEVKKGDLIFCHKDGEVIYLATAITNAYESPRPESRTFKEWKHDGTQIDVDLYIFDRPIPVDNFRSIFIAHYNKHCEPIVFNSNGACHQNYMSKIPQDAAKMIATFINEDVFLDFKDKNSSLIAPKGSNKEVMIQARIGQGRYRKSLLKLWGNKCAVTGVGDSELLIASHIVAWTISSPKEKVDPYNGFPLTPNLDKLFDLGLISFDDNGQILVKKKIEKSLKKLNLSKELKLRHVFEQNIRYLKKHRELFKFD